MPITMPTEPRRERPMSIFRPNTHTLPKMDSRARGAAGSLCTTLALPIPLFDRHGGIAIETRAAKGLISAFGELEDFETAVGAVGSVGLLVTGRGRFRAKLTQLSLDRLRLMAGDETLPRVALVTVPPHGVLVSLALDGGALPIWGGIEARSGEIITIAPGQKSHARTIGPCRWGAILGSARDFLEYGAAMSGSHFDLPSGITRWRPPALAERQLRQLYQAAMRMADVRSETLVDAVAAHGLEQQLFHALINCMVEGAAEEEGVTSRRRRDLVVRFEERIQTDQSRRLTEICAALGVSKRLLRESTHQQLNITPERYLRMRRLLEAQRVLRSADPHSTTVLQVASQHGFRNLSRFVRDYRAIYGELPSATLRRPWLPQI